MRFFDFEPSYIDWLLGYARNRPILDVGCGEGHLLRDILAQTWKAHGIDFRRLADEDIEPHVTFMDIEDAKLAKLTGWLLVLARPCHGGFVQKALKGSVSEVLIFTRPSTIEADAGEYFPQLTELKVPGLLPASNGEEIACFRYEPEQSGNPWEEYEVLGASGMLVDTMWVQRIRGDQYQDLTGSADDLDGLARCSSVQAAAAGKRLRSAGAHWRTVPLLPPRRGYVRDDGKKYHGWVGPTGLLFTCEYFEHDQIAYDVLHLTAEEAGLMGWKKTVALTSYDDETILAYSSFGGGTEPTQEQLIVLEELNLRYKRILART